MSLLPRTVSGDLYARPTVPLQDSELTKAFDTGALGKSYKHQYANIYFVRLAKLRKAVEESAAQKWTGIEGDPKPMKRVLDVEKSRLCYIVGTVYMDMPLKPNVLEDISKDHWIAAPPPRPKIYSPEDNVMLEDESGRIRLVGDAVRKATLVTGVIMGVLGAETSTGDFEVVDICFAGMPPQANSSPPGGTVDAMDVDGVDGSDSTTSGHWVALVSGLDVGASSSPSDVRIQLLVEHLTAEGGLLESQEASARISRLIIAGNSLTPPIRNEDTQKPKRYGYDAASYTAAPTLSLASYLLDISRSLPIHLVPGPSDPAGVTLPQQPMPRAMFGEVKKAEGFRCETNPCWIPLEGCAMLGVGGQTLDDIFKYVGSEDRLEMAKSTLLWRHLAPTAPDTLWCYPFFDRDPFIISALPHVYFIGNQPEFKTSLLKGPHGQRTRIILVPRFSQTGEVVLVNTVSLEIKRMRFEVSPAWEDAEQ